MRIVPSLIIDEHFNHNTGNYSLSLSTLQKLYAKQILPYLPSLADGFIKDDPRSNRGIQRRNLPFHGDFNKEIALLLNQAADASALAADDNGKPSLKIDICVELIRSI
jgi:hypothetical protein